MGLGLRTVIWTSQKEVNSLEYRKKEAHTAFIDDGPVLDVLRTNGKTKMEVS